MEWTSRREGILEKEKYHNQTIVTRRSKVKKVQVLEVIDPQTEDALYFVEHYTYEQCSSTFS